MSLLRFLLALLASTLAAQGQVSPLERQVPVFEGSFVDLERGLVTNLAEEEGLDLGVESSGTSPSADRSVDVLEVKGMEDWGLSLVPRGDVGIQRLEPSEEAWSFDSIAVLPENGYENTSFPLRADSWFAVRTEAGQYAKVRVVGELPTRLELHYLLLRGGGRELPAPPAGLSVETSETARLVRFEAQPGVSYLLRRRVHGEDAWVEHALDASPFEDAADLGRPVFYELSRLLQDGGRSLSARVLSPALDRSRSGRLRCRQGSFVDFFEGRVGGTETHVTVTQTFDQGARILTGSDVAVRGEEGVIREDGRLVVPPVGFRGDHRYLMLDAGCFLRLPGGYFVHLRLIGIEGAGKGEAEVVLEYQLGEHGQIAFVPIPSVPDLEVRGAALSLTWGEGRMEGTYEVRRTVSGLRAAARIVSVEESAWVDTAPVPEAWNAYAVRVVTSEGQRSPWSEEVGFLPFDARDPESVARAVGIVLEAWGSSDPLRREAALLALASLSEHARSPLRALAEGSGPDAERAADLLDELETNARDVPVAQGLVALRERLAAVEDLRNLEAFGSEERGERLHAMLHEVKTGQLRSVLRIFVESDPDPVVRRLAAAFLDLVDPWNLERSEPFAAPLGSVPLESYDFSRETVREIFAERPFDAERVATILESWVSPEFPREAMVLLTLAEMVRADDLEQRDLAEIGMRLLVGKERGSPAAERVSTVVRLAEPKAQCRSMGRFHEIWRTRIRTRLEQGRTVVVRPDQGLSRVQELLDEAEPGTVIVLEEGDYRSQGANPMLRIERSGIALRAIRPGSVRLHTSLLVTGCRGIVLEGLTFARQRAYTFQITESSMACLRSTIEAGSSGCAMLTDSTLALDHCRILGQATGTGVYVRGSTLLADATVFDGFQTTVQGQATGGLAWFHMTRCGFLGMAHAGLQVSGEGLPVFLDRCYFAGGRYGVSYLSEGAVGRCLFADLQAGTNQLREGVHYDPSLLIELDVRSPTNIGTATSDPDVVEWFRDR